MSPDPRTLSAIEATDTDVLIHIIDGHCAAGDWEELVGLRSLCRDAVGRGKQLWAIEEHIRYRLALEAPPEYAGPVVTEGPTRFTLGPLPEVVAGSHGWDELEPHLTDGPEREMVAHERVIRGEDLTDQIGETYVLELPLSLQAWEPEYPVATYEAHRAEFPTPSTGNLELASCHRAAAIPDPGVTEALAELVTPWIEQSNGHLDVVAVNGQAFDAIGAAGPSRVYARRLEPAEALAWMCWAAASGGAHGRRRGTAAGRFGAWWAAAALTGTEWPPDPRQLGQRLQALHWWLWSDGTTSGWALRLAIEDPRAHRAWAIGANDARL